MKKILLFAIAVLASTTINANASFKDGAILGINLGYSNLYVKSTENLFYTSPIDKQDNGSFKKTRRNGSFVADFIAGYRKFCNNKFMFGVDLSISIDNNKIKHTHTSPIADATSETKFNRKLSVTPALVVGVIFAKQWMSYAKLGMIISSFNIRNKVIHENIEIDPQSTKIIKIGVKPTIGVEYSINDRFSATTEISYEYFNKMDYSLRNPTIGPIFNGSTHSVKLEPSYFTVKIGAMYKF